MLDNSHSLFPEEGPQRLLRGTSHTVRGGLSPLCSRTTTVWCRSRGILRGQSSCSGQRGSSSGIAGCGGGALVGLQQSLQILWNLNNNNTV